eukprot:g5523.t1
MLNQRDYPRQQAPRQQMPYQSMQHQQDSLQHSSYQLPRGVQHQAQPQQQQHQQQQQQHQQQQHNPNYSNYGYHESAYGGAQFPSGKQAKYRQRKFNQKLKQHEMHPPKKSTSVSPINKVLFKTALCRHFLNGFCNRGSSCNFAHGRHEVQPIVSKTSPPASVSSLWNYTQNNGNDDPTQRFNLGDLLNSVNSPDDNVSPQPGISNFNSPQNDNKNVQQQQQQQQPIGKENGLRYSGNVVGENRSNPSNSSRFGKIFAGESSNVNGNGNVIGRNTVKSGGLSFGALGNTANGSTFGLGSLNANLNNLSLTSSNHKPFNGSDDGLNHLMRAAANTNDTSSLLTTFPSSKTKALTGAASGAVSSGTTMVPPSGSGESDLPPSWRRVFDSHKNVYFWNETTNVTQWEHPLKNVNTATTSSPSSGTVVADSTFSKVPHLTPSSEVSSLSSPLTPPQEGGKEGDDKKAVEGEDDGVLSCANGEELKCTAAEKAWVKTNLPTAGTMAATTVRAIIDAGMGKN